MKKSILNLSGALELTKSEQKSTIGGIRPRCTVDRNVPCNSNSGCLSGEGCYVTNAGEINAPIVALCQCLRK